MFIIFLLIGLAAAQNPEQGICQIIQPLQNFDLPQYLGLWFEIERYEAINQLNMDCVGANYSLNNDGSVKVLNRGRLDNVWNERIGVALLPNASAVPLPAKLMVSFTGTPDTVNYQVIDTDYKTFSIVWNCQQLTATTKLESMWLLSRLPTLDPRPARVDQLMTQYFDREKIRVTEQQDCMEDDDDDDNSASRPCLLGTTLAILIAIRALV